MPLAPAAQRFKQQVEALRKSAKVEPHGDPDGVGVVRSLKVDAATGKWLKPRIEAIEDERIESFKRNVVTFVPTVAADFAHDFYLADADRVLSEGPPQAENVNEEALSAAETADEEQAEE